MINTSGLTGLFSSSSYLTTPISLCETLQPSFNYYNMSLNYLYNRFKLNSIMHDPLQTEERNTVICYISLCLLECVKDGCLIPIVFAVYFLLALKLTVKCTTVLHVSVSGSAISQRGSEGPLAAPGHFVCCSLWTKLRSVTFSFPQYVSVSFHEYSIRIRLAQWFPT
jgi:hypothetical protein